MIINRIHKHQNLLSL